jgi:transcriptional regulator with XRE-family HTH domain
MTRMPPRPEQPTAFGVNLRRLRKDADLSQADLAVRSGLGKPTISYLETGRSGSPRMETVAALAYGLECDPSTLLGREPPGKLAPKRKRPEVIEWVRGRDGILRVKRPGGPG